MTMKQDYSVSTRIFRTVVFAICTFLLFQFVSLYLSWPKQAVLGGFTLLIAIFLNKRWKSHSVTLALMLLSMAATLRYVWWRIHLVTNFFTDPSNHRVSIDAFLMLILLSAEAYTICVMVLGYLQTSYLLERKPIPLPMDVSLWPHVDLLIPTYNEALSLVRFTALAAINIDYPPEKLHVYILDDGTREDFRLFAKQLGIGYITRKVHDHAKAGNINHAMTLMTSPLVAIFDCDHVPTRSFLQFTIGWFLVDPGLALVQTPHYFYSPDPFERNLLQYKSIPNEAELFYGVIQDGNDLWNATFFCGSCAVLRREALEEVGGIAVETVTEDAHTSLRMQSRGWNTAYINVAQAAGLATETLAGHVGQRVRWARGMIQILRIENPLLARGMKLTQRLCYFNAMMHFMYAVPRLIFLLAPLAYMLFGRIIIPGYWVAILAYALPHLAISSMTNSRVQGRHRHSFWNEIYETVLAPYILLPTLLALINPKLGSFNVTDKGTTLNQTRFDRKIAAPTTWLLLANFAGVLAAPYRLFELDPQHPGVIISNLCWILFNMVILGVAAAVAHEQKQRRSSVRINARIPILVELLDGRKVTGMTKDMSVGGASVELSDPDLTLHPGDMIRIAFPQQTGNDQITSTIIGNRAGDLRLQFIALSLAEQETLTRALYSRANSWIHGHDSMEQDRPLLSLARIVRLSFTGLKQVFLGLFPQKREVEPNVVARTASMLVLTAVCFAASHLDAQARRTIEKVRQPSLSSTEVSSTPADSAITTRITFKDLGVLGAAAMRGPHSYYTLHLVLPHTQLARAATLKLSYRFSPSLVRYSGSLRIRLNNALVGEVVSPATGLPDDVFAVTSLPIPAELLVRENDLSFEFTGNGVLQTGAIAKTLVLASIGDASFIEIVSKSLLLRNDLSLLPLPIYDSALQSTTTIPFVFMTQPDTKMLKAAGIVASWFGVLASVKPIRFTVSIGQVPPGNVVIFQNGSSTTANSAGSVLAAPSFSIRTNPSDPNSSALILAGGDGDQLITVAQALSLTKRPGLTANGEPAALQGESMQIDQFSLPAPRGVDDAPRWLPSDRLVSLWNYSSQSVAQGDGSQPIPIYFRVSPDLYYGENQNLQLLISYRYNSRAIASGSALRIFSNGVLINETPLMPGKDFDDRQRKVILPVVDMRPFGNTLLFSFDFIPRFSDNSAEPPNAQLQGTILPNSSLDIRGMNRWTEMPNLELFANAGFPFTRRADLGKTVVVLPSHPTPSEIALFLHLMSHCGTQTGYPALRMEVAGPNDTVLEDYDYLILGTIANQPAFAALQASLPVQFDSVGVHFKQTDSYWNQLKQAWEKALNVTKLKRPTEVDVSIPDAVVAGIESPYAPGRSLVVIALRDDNAEEQFASAFLARSQSSDISHSVSLLRGTEFSSYNVDTPAYHIGDISHYTVMRIWFAEYFWVLILAVTFCSLVLGKWTFEYLSRRALLRLSLANRSDPLRSLTEFDPNEG
jgi:cellulose synthase (UDP-forming)